jgi:hypothetical protein
MQGALIKRSIVFGSNESSLALLSIIDERIVSSSDWTRKTLQFANACVSGVITEAYDLIEGVKRESRSASVFNLPAMWSP